MATQNPIYTDIDAFRSAYQKTFSSDPSKMTFNEKVIGGNTPEAYRDFLVKAQQSNDPSYGMYMSKLESNYDPTFTVPQTDAYGNIMSLPPPTPGVIQSSTPTQEEKNYLAYGGTPPKTTTSRIVPVEAPTAPITQQTQPTQLTPQQVTTKRDEYLSKYGYAPPDTELTSGQLSQASLAELQKRGYTAPTAPTTPTGTAEQPVAAPTGNTLDEIQASPIPPLPAGYGEGSGLDPANWALQHRQNIFNAYQKYGITPSAEEVNWQLTHNPDINSIEQSIAQAVSSGQDTRGKMPTGSEADTKASSVIKSITSPDANGQEKSLADVVKEFSISMGLTDITKQIQAVDDQYGDEVMAVNENPWLSEGMRSKKIQLLDSKYESKKKALIDRLKLQEDAVAKAVDYWQKDREYKKDILFKQLDLQSKELDRQLTAEKEARATSTSFQNIGGREVMITYDSQGKIVSQVDLGMSGSPKSSGGGGGGKTPKTQTGVSDSSELPSGWENNGDVLRELVTEDISAGGTREQIDQLYREHGANMELVTALLNELLPESEEKSPGIWETISGIGDWLDSYKDKVRESKGWATKNKPASTNKGGW